MLKNKFGKLITDLPCSSSIFIAVPLWDCACKDQLWTRDFPLKAEGASPQWLFLLRLSHGPKVGTPFPLSSFSATMWIGAFQFSCTFSSYHFYQMCFFLFSEGPSFLASTSSFFLWSFFPFLCEGLFVWGEVTLIGLPFSPSYATACGVQHDD